MNQDMFCLVEDLPVLIITSSLDNVCFVRNISHLPYYGEIILIGIGASLHLKTTV